MNTRLLKKWRTEASKLFNENVCIKSDIDGLYIGLPYIVECWNNSYDVRMNDVTVYNDFLSNKESLYGVKTVKRLYDKYYDEFLYDYTVLMLNKKKKKHPYKGFKIKFFTVKRR